ncbi:hypothetical protein CONLIGDRAFT_205943 [Coniochaeta ligniaria NRRL 30616]|uniref:Uncharacterized protein n=1 Tax=Coniochaeta ligniaria NRRL 30616 TaxID=1408157 RepID=A0A1J7JVE7_9PEZI|nr:hypothetical protein CONLIGDRAFT_205943 [Coniochaeta ligniaria NRRL 30616]
MDDTDFLGIESNGLHRLFRLLHRFVLRKAWLPQVNLEAKKDEITGDAVFVLGTKLVCSSLNQFTETCIDVATSATNGAQSNHAIPTSCRDGIDNVLPSSGLTHACHACPSRDCSALLLVQDPILGRRDVLSCVIWALDLRPGYVRGCAIHGEGSPKQTDTTQSGRRFLRCGSGWNTVNQLSSISRFGLDTETMVPSLAWSLLVLLTRFLLATPSMCQLCFSSSVPSRAASSCPAWNALGLGSFR